MSSSDLYGVLISYGAALDSGVDLPKEPPLEQLVHESLLDGLSQDFCTKTLPLLVELQYLNKNATVADVQPLFKSLDTWQDLDTFDDFFADAIETIEKMPTQSAIGEERKSELLNILKTEKTEVLRSLDFQSWMPEACASERGNLVFHRLLIQLSGLAFKESHLVAVTER
jgi:hypothetical protein